MPIPDSTSDISPAASQPGLLIIGATKTGKTHYGGQLLRRLQIRRGELRMVGTPSDLTVFQEVCGRLANGRSAPHTPTGFYRESVWNVRTEDEAMHATLIWPDYGGEDIENITKLRNFTEAWVQRIQETQGWLLFIRLSLLRAPEDILVRPRSRDQMNAGGEAPSTTDVNPVSGNEQNNDESISSPHETEHEIPTQSLSDQARIVELLQALLFAKQIKGDALLRRPTLLIALSCWDELPDNRRDGSWERPRLLFQKRLPLVNDFIESNWEADAFEVIGLSALGKSLRDDVSDEQFMETGPERQGWCILPDGTESSDLTLPVKILMEKTKRGMDWDE